MNNGVHGVSVFYIGKVCGVSSVSVVGCINITRPVTLSNR